MKRIRPNFASANYRQAKKTDESATAHPDFNDSALYSIECPWDTPLGLGVSLRAGPNWISSLPEFLCPESAATAPNQLRIPIAAILPSSYPEYTFRTVFQGVPPSPPQNQLPTT